MQNKISLIKSVIISIVLTLSFQSGLFAAGNLLHDNGFELSDPNGGFPDSGFWNGAWLGYGGAGCTTTSARSANNGLWQYTGLASDSWQTRVFQDVQSWPGRVYFASVWVRTDFDGASWVAGSRAFIKLRFLDESQNTLAEYTSRDINTADSDWMLLYFATHPAPAHTRFARFEFCLEKPQSVGQTIANFDDCILRQIECEDCVRLDEVPTCGSAENLKGSVVGVNPDDYKVGVYLFVDQWWPKPTFANPWTDINSDGSWQCDITTHDFDFSATEIVAFLVPKTEIADWPFDFNNPVNLPALPGEAFRFPSTGSFRPSCFAKDINFAGRKWLVKDSGNGTVGPGPNLFDHNNVWVDANGLHLKITNVDGQWRCAEVFTEDVLADGLFTFKISSDISSLDPNVVLGMFTWDEFAPHYANREMDFEVSQWGNPNNDNAQFVIQPWDALGNLHRFNIDPCDLVGTTHILDWSYDSAAFESFFGQNPDDAAKLIDSWVFSGNAVPRPGKENVRISLWLRDGLAPADVNEVEVVINDFQFVPCTYDLETSSLDFNSVLISKNATKTVKISNGARCAPYLIAVSVTGPDADNFLVADRAFEMEPGASKEIEVAFMPDSNRIYNATLEIAGDAKTETVPLTGRGVRLEYSRVPTIGSPDFLEGFVQGVRPASYRVVSYVFTDKWYIKPHSNSSAKRTIAADGSWRCDIDVESTDVNVTRVASFLVPKNDDLPPNVLDSLDDSRLGQYDRISSDKPKLDISKVTAHAGTADNDSIVIGGRYFVDMAEILDADSLCVNILQADNSLWQICVPFDFIGFIRNNGFTYNKAGVNIRLQNSKRVSASFAGSFRIQLARTDLTGLRSPVTLNLGIGDFNEIAVADESLNSRIINGSQPIPIQFLSGFTDALRVDKMTFKPNSKYRGSLYVKGAVVFQDSVPDLTEEDVVIGLGNDTFTIPAGSIRKYGSTGLKYRCVNSPVAQGGIANAIFDFQNSSFWVKISKTKLDEYSGAVAFNLAMGAFSEGVSVETGK